ncbi:hypothetical protein B0H17DRAFT_1135539 [Mycena rosella]|uniref:Uncharacterized protein n=1 Tax=Mycena rosella TaxID=1033263 RepID=A0AAD7GFD9_MYCRO|nr:hypothetical protein B0H17DRAFT_1135539 [Mycena rosella]
MSIILGWNRATESMCALAALVIREALRRITQQNINRQVAHEPLEPPSGSRNVRKRVAPPSKNDVNGCEWLVGATCLLFLRTVREPLGGSSGSDSGGTCAHADGSDTGKINSGRRSLTTGVGTESPITTTGGSSRRVVTPTLNRGIFPVGDRKSEIAAACKLETSLRRSSRWGDAQFGALGAGYTWGEKIVDLLEITMELRWSLEIPRRVPASLTRSDHDAGAQGSMGEGIRIHASASCTPDGCRAQKDSICATGRALWQWVSAHWDLALCTPSVQAVEGKQGQKGDQEAAVLQLEGRRDWWEWDLGNPRLRSANARSWDSTPIVGLAYIRPSIDQLQPRACTTQWAPRQAVAPPVGPAASGKGGPRGSPPHKISI